MKLKSIKTEKNINVINVNRVNCLIINSVTALNRI